jgi:hypothetical protein
MTVAGWINQSTRGQIVDFREEIPQHLDQSPIVAQDLESPPLADKLSDAGRHLRHRFGHAVLPRVFQFRQALPRPVDDSRPPQVVDSENPDISAFDVASEAVRGGTASGYTGESARTSRALSTISLLTAGWMNVTCSLRTPILPLRSTAIRVELSARTTFRLGNGRL